MFFCRQKACEIRSADIREILMVERPPPYKLFFAPLAVEFSPNDYESVQFAYFASKFGHASQTRDDGTRYFDHPKSVAWSYIDEFGGRNVRIIIDSLLHDLDEDTYLLSSYRVSRNFGREVALDVVALTKLPVGKETTEQYLQRVIARGEEAITAKLLDRLHNMRTLSVCGPEKIEKMVKETVEYHIPMLIPALREYGDEAKALADRINVQIQNPFGHSQST